ncbi:radical SAM family heme chaperone HemW [Gallibacterium trehalosifermentans]|uniref:Heme chaperone HemW n=1 Tax=Gallibacterium trehalosifermentans TaxID=516935 RepID=A0ABV6H1J3_9PAST
MIVLPPLSLYIHIPWCVQKCPYCDFNSHAQKGEIPEQAYLQHLLADLDQQLSYVQGRELHSIFIGGGTPSLFSAESIAYLLQQIALRIPYREQIEITLEANPGTAEAQRFLGYRQAGVTRLSMGVQSFHNPQLQLLGRIHNSDEAKRAVMFAQQAGFERFNLDLMHGLPNQTLDNALSDLQQAIELNPPHLSWYQLTIEPNTLFASKPPKLPDDDLLWEIFAAGHKKLTAAGYQQYETSAYAKAGFQCEHNLNYWRFGDYLAIGCGAHGKVTFPEGNILRYSQTKHPQGYLQGNYRYQQYEIAEKDRPFEFFMNRFRLLEPVAKQDFMQFTGLSLMTIEKQIDAAQKQDYIVEHREYWQITEHGKLFLNDLLTLFLSEE